MEVPELEVRKTSLFERWMRRMKDVEARTLVAMRIRRLQFGHFGDVRGVGEGVFELRVDHGPGYRIYGIRQGDRVILLLCGGDKGSQAQDVARAKRMAASIRREGGFDA
ncbi:type II toxin-antitoxin system RelE/ParE family toxin [Arabiibacter massiliensis]|uniref:type II toxin-antitoxin system RelE/ParE family toxin n=1 Tax=Arabiibacter massiliensis TaxID=1870985 RepID=UPI0009BA2009|nr:type II toxin-antitoxin system RelE/ParE family toxin [Arabiibacter massiliensis]